MSVGYSHSTAESGTESQQDESIQVDSFTQAASQVREDIERMVEGLDFQGVSRKLEEFGRRNPVGLAMTALAMGVAVGLLMRRNSELGGDRLKGLKRDLTPVA